MSCNYNELKNNNFMFTLSRIPETNFRVVECDLPSINVPLPQIGAPGSSQFFPGTFNEFEPLTIRFNVDENLHNYGEIYKWIIQQKSSIGGRYVPSNELEKPMVSDGFLTTLTNASTPNRTFKFKDLVPYFLSGWTFDTTVDIPTIVTATVSFRYSEMEFV